jgi:hypothetical protein
VTFQRSVAVACLSISPCRWILKPDLAPTLRRPRDRKKDGTVSLKKLQNEIATIGRARSNCARTIADADTLLFGEMPHPYSDAAVHNGEARIAT